MAKIKKTGILSIGEIVEHLELLSNIAHIKSKW